MLFSVITKRPLIALDFGTANCLIIKNKLGIVLNEPTVVAISKKTLRVIGVGKYAKEVLGRENRSIFAKRPLQNGGISNYKLAYMLMEKFLDKVLGRYQFIKPDVYVSVPSKINSIEERALIKALESYGVNKKVLIPEPLAASIGAELNVKKSLGSMVVNLGGGTAEIAIVANGDIVSSTSHKGSGELMNLKIVESIKSKYGIDVGEQTAEKIKHKIAAAILPEENQIVQISGKDSATGEIKNIFINSSDIIDAVRFVLIQVIKEVKDVLSNSDAEIAKDVSEFGIALTGGTALVQNIDIYFTKMLNVPCFVVEDPITAVVRGLRKYIENNF
jgi:rod shape-determining protein MreB